jgi:hypothetical protein
MQHMIQLLENRRLMSAGPTEPLTPILQDMAVTGFAAVAKNYEVGYLPTVSVSHVSQLRGSINWGDGTSSPASFWRDKKGGIDIVDTHTYAKPGTFAITSSLITETPYVKPGGATPKYILDLGTVNTTATIASTPARLTETAGVSFTATLGTFEGTSLFGPIFTAKINWGDGVTSAGTIKDGAANQDNWTITGTHTYAHTGTYIVNVYLYSQVPAAHQKPGLDKDFITLIPVVPPVK